MANAVLNKKQELILDYLKKEILRRGFPPSVREIGEAVGLKSTSSVHAHLEALEKKGYIRKDATKPRAIEITDDSFRKERIRQRAAGYEDLENSSEYAQVPVIGNVATRQRQFAVFVCGGPSGT